MTKSSIAVLAIVFLALVAITFFWANRPRKVVIIAELPASFPEESFSHASFEELLLTYVDTDGRVDYARWHQYPASVQMLESYLAASEFVNDPDNVDVDHDDQVVHLSRIFKWYKSDFVSDVRPGGKPVENGLLSYVSRYAAGDLSNDVARARGYRIVFREYDWNLNSLTN